MEFQDSKSTYSVNSNDTLNTLFNIAIIAIGLGIVYFLFKGSQSPQQAVQSTYQNDEQYHITRGYDGFIEDFGVSRNASVANADTSIPIDINNKYQSQSDSYIKDTEVIYDRRQLNRYITDLVAKGVSDIINNNTINPINPYTDNRYGVNMRNDQARQRRFGFN